MQRDLSRVCTCAYMSANLFINTCTYKIICTYPIHICAEVCGVAQVSKKDVGRCFSKIHKCMCILYLLYVWEGDGKQKFLHTRTHTRIHTLTHTYAHTHKYRQIVQKIKASAERESASSSTISRKCLCTYAYDMLLTFSIQQIRFCNLLKLPQKLKNSALHILTTAKKSGVLGGYACAYVCMCMRICE